MDQKIQPQPLNPIPPGNKNRVITAVILGILLIGAGVFIWEKVLHNQGGVPDYGLFPPPSDSLQLSTYRGMTPLTVHVIGPPQLISLPIKVAQRWVGCGFDIDWGDNTEASDDCASNLVHTYTIGGTITVKARVWHPGPDDGPITDWGGVADIQTIKAGGKSATTATSTATQNTAISEIELVVGGNFQGTSYRVKDSKLVYSHSDIKGEQNSTTIMTSVDIANLDSLLAKYELNALHNDPPPPPDTTNYGLTITRGGGTRTFSFSLSQNPGYLLAVDLNNFFARIRNKTPANPCSNPTENCVHVIQATIKNSCAPWDGPALNISMNYNSGIFSAQIFAKGLALFKAGKPVVINESLDSTNGTGLASFCATDTTCVAYHSGEVKINNPSGVFKENTPVTRLNIVINGAVIPVEANWDNAAVVPCG